MKLPKHINLTIEHQPHRPEYSTVVDWVENNRAAVHMVDPDEMVRTGEVWQVHWHPETLVGSYCVAASTLELALLAANRVEPCR